MTDEQIQAWKESLESEAAAVVGGMKPTTVPRAVADRLAEALEASLGVLRHPDPSGHPALAEYRKAVGL